ncbi:MAG: hypothetical protein JST35_07575 [Armatimonadetes bacterium]|nr:hypothetical protein [Armatimonadota bacterium]
MTFGAAQAALREQFGRSKKPAKVFRYRDSEHEPTIRRHLTKYSWDEVPLEGIAELWTSDAWGSVSIEAKHYYAPGILLSVLEGSVTAQTLDYVGAMLDTFEFSIRDSDSGLFAYSTEQLKALVIAQDSIQRRYDHGMHGSFYERILVQFGGNQQS